jgi:hypothetical protein
MNDTAGMNDTAALDELMVDNTERIDALCKRGINPMEVSAVIRQINEDTVFAHILHHLGRLAAVLVPDEESGDLLTLARLTAAGKLSRWLDAAEKQVEKSRLVVAGPRG